MEQQSKDFLFDLLDTPSPTGFEGPGQQVWSDYLRPHVDGVERNTYGSAWAYLQGTAGEQASRLMLGAHADEIGFMVQHITDSGFIYVNRIGGSDPAIARGQRVRILGSKEPVLGMIGNTAIHLREKDDDKLPKVHELFVDIGADSREEVAERGIRVGHPMVYDVAPVELTDSRISGRAIDNRLGGFIIAQVMTRLAGEKPSCTVQALNTVQEEIGGYGARMSAYQLEPDVAVVFDVTHSTDSPGIDKNKHGAVEMGGGPTVTHGTANHPRVVERLIATADQEDIPLQHEASSRRTGTDTDSIFHSRSGVPSALVSVPLRYMHSTVEVVDLRDVEQCIQLLTAFAKSIQEEETFSTAGREERRR